VFVKVLAPIFIVALLATATGCGSSPTAPTATAGAMPVASLNLTGTRIGTPLCGLTMSVTTTDVAAGRIVSAYTGSTTCEGPSTDGMLVMSR